MRSPKITTGELLKVDVGWTNGMNTLRSPWLLKEGQYRRGVNIVNRGGVAQTRPGFDMKLILPPGNLQGGELFQINISDRLEDWLVVAVEGLVYALPFPLQQPKSWRKFQLADIQFDAKAPYVYFCVAQQTVTLNSDQSLQVVPTYNVLMMQDGVSAAAFFNGEEARHLDETSPKLETPRGTWMAFSGGRLWVARDKVVIASDAYDPLAFTERVAGQGRGDFTYPRYITGLKSFISNDNQETVTVFTDERSEVIRSGIRDRSKWPLTANFQQVLFPSTGCVSGHSIVFQAGLMWWYSNGGLVSSDSAASNYVTSQINFRDAEMAFSKQFMAEDQSGICGLSFENYLLMSMPIGESLNSQTFVMDYAVMSEYGADHQPAWSSVWTGIRPMKWITGKIGPRRRAFALSIDYSALDDGSFNHLWEAFMPEREDSFFEMASDFSTTPYQQPIYCEFESRMLGDGLDLKAMKYAELDFKELSGDVGIQVDFRGTRGAYKTIMSKQLLAPSGYDVAGVSELTNNASQYGILRKQSRRLITEMAKDTSGGDQTCESENSEHIDKAFCLLVHWCGQAALDSIKLYLEPWAEASSGKCEADEDRVCVVDEFGVNHLFHRDKDFVPVEKLYETVQRQQWIATKSYTKSITCPSGSVTGAISVTASATYRSEVSQADADSQAATLAQESATNQANYLHSIYPCYYDSVQYFTRYCYGTLNGAVEALAANNSGQFVLGGDFWLDNATQQGKITLRDTDGTRILSYTKQNGFLATPVAEPSALKIRAIAHAPGDDTMVVVGNFNQYTNQPRVNIARLLSDGSLDPTTSFGTGLTGGLPSAVAVQGDYSIIAGGAFTGYNGTVLAVPLVRVSRYGAYDATYIPSGLTAVLALKLQTNGLLIVVGYDSGSGNLVVKRLLSDGTDDGAFTPYLEPMSAPAYAALAIDGAGKLIVSVPGINSGKNLLRLTSEGALDTTYDVGSGLDVAARAAALDVYGNVLLGGGFTTYAGASVGKLVRTDALGALDSALVTGTGFNGDVNTLLIDSSGNLILGGGFTAYNSVANTAYFCMLTASGTVIPSVQSTYQGGAARSRINQADADAQALLMAQQSATVALPCT